MKNERFEECFLKYRNLIMKAVMNKTSDYQLAQEICQQVFMTYYCHMDTVDEKFEKLWLLKCTQNALVDYLRKDGLRNGVNQEIIFQKTGNVVEIPLTDCYEKNVMDKELTGRILRDVRKVNVIWYEILVMYCVYGLSHKEVARKLHITEDVARARLYRARKYVREKYGDEYWSDR